MAEICFFLNSSPFSAFFGRKMILGMKQCGWGFSEYRQDFFKHGLSWQAVNVYRVRVAARECWRPGGSSWRPGKTSEKTAEAVGSWCRSQAWDRKAHLSKQPPVTNRHLDLHKARNARLKRELFIYQLRIRQTSNASKSHQNTGFLTWRAVCCPTCSECRLIPQFFKA